METDKSCASSGCIVDAGVHHTHEPIGTSAISLHPPPSSPTPDPHLKLVIPDFLFGKYNIHGYLTNVKEAGFRALLENYIKFELSDRSGIHGVLPTARQPNAVTWWNNRARIDKLPPFDSLNSLTKNIITWWTFIQPDWRRIQLSETSRTEGDWERLYKPGVNGLLNVVILTYWWARILEEREESPDEPYFWFVSDVMWILSQLTVAARMGTIS